MVATSLALEMPTPVLPERFLTPEEDARIASVLPKFGLREQALFMLVRHSAICLKDALPLRVKDVWDFNENHMKGAIQRNTVKIRVFSATRPIPAICHPTLTALILQLGQQPEAFLFRSREGGGGPVGRKTAFLWTVTIGEAAGILGLNPQRLYATAAHDFYLACGANLITTAEWLGHANVTTTSLLVGSAESRVVRNGRMHGQRAGRQRVQLKNELSFKTALTSEYEAENVRLSSELDQASTKVRELQNSLAIVTAERDALALRSATVVGVRTPRRLTDFPVACDLLYGDQILFDRPALRSLEDSPFQDVAAAWSSIELLWEAFLPHYASGAPFATVQRALDKSRIDYGSHIVEMTVGRHSSFYLRNYQGQRITLQKHLKLGTSRDPARCFRLFFEWLPESRQILILHAGRHHPTTE